MLVIEQEYCEYVNFQITEFLWSPFHSACTAGTALCLESIMLDCHFLSAKSPMKKVLYISHNMTCVARISPSHYPPGSAVI